MRYLFVTGKLAEPALRQVLAQLAPKVGFEYEIAVLNISVAALMTPDWIARHLEVPDAVDRIMIPGWCGEDARPIQEKTHLPVEIGPKDLLDLPVYFGQRRQVDLQEYRIEILAEINYASRLDRQSLLAEARRLHAEGADVIDLGCDPATVWTDIADAVKCLREAGLRVSVDSFHPREIAEAVRAGAELVLSVNSSNIEAAPDWGCEVVLIPDSPHRSGDSSAGSDSWLTTLDRHMEWLAKHGVAFRVDPILEPIGSGFAELAGTVSGVSAKVSAGAHAHGNRQSHGTVRGGLGGGESAAAGIVRRIEHRQCVDHAGGQLVPELCPRVRFSPTPCALRRSTRGATQKPRPAPGHAAG
jgi:hypothetical protein